MHRYSVQPQRRPRKRERRMPGAKDRRASPNAKLPFPLPADYQISNRNTPEFRISPNSNKTQRILISNRNINPHFDLNVAIDSSPPPSNRLFPASRISNRQFARLEIAPKSMKTWARRDF
jgi:hypothetical protein